MHFRKLLLVAVAAAIPIAAVPAVAAAAPAARSDVLAAGAALAVDKPIRSANGRYSLVLQRDGNVVHIGTEKPWATATNAPGARAVMQADGNFVVSSAEGKPLFDTETSGYPGSTMTVQDDGNLVIYTPRGEAIWSRHMMLGRVPAGRMLEGGDIVRSRANTCFLGMQKDGNLVLYRVDTKQALWNSRTGVPGSRLQMQRDGNLVIVAPGEKPVWESRTAGHPGAWLGMQDDCNAVVNSVQKKVLWATGTAR